MQVQAPGPGSGPGSGSQISGLGRADGDAGTVARYTVDKSPPGPQLNFSTYTQEHTHTHTRTYVGS